MKRIILLINSLLLISLSFGQCESFDFDLIPSNPWCFDSSNGEITLNAFGGEEPYTYEIKNESDEIVNVGNVASDIPRGLYTIKVGDAAGCLIEIEYELSSPDQLVLSTEWFGDFSANEGILAMTASGGIPSYSYVWEKIGTAETVINATWGGLGVGCYKGTVTDAYGCEKSKTLCFDETGYVSLSEETSEKNTIAYQPSQQMLNIYSDNSKQIRVFNLNGQEMLVSNLNPGNNSTSINLKKGVYVYQFFDQKGNTTTGKFVVY